MKRSAWLGTLVAPPVVSLAYVAIVALLPDPTPKGDRTLGALFGALFIFFIPASYLASLLFGAPLYYLLKRWGKLSFAWLVALAAPLGVVAVSFCLAAMVVLFDGTVLWGDIGWGKVVGYVAGSAAYGAGIAGVFCWLAGVPRRPAA
ncbi:MAG TPA: hypothetical protein VFR01_00395 [Geobacterales bacterium]|nr:hypothetical protein [Geobacterales bacterium]